MKTAKDQRHSEGKMTKAKLDQFPVKIRRHDFARQKHSCRHEICANEEKRNSHATFTVEAKNMLMRSLKERTDLNVLREERKCKEVKHLGKEYVNSEMGYPQQERAAGYIFPKYRRWEISCVWSQVKEIDTKVVETRQTRVKENIDPCDIPNSNAQMSLTHE